MQEHMESDPTPTESTAAPPVEERVADAMAPMTELVETVQREIRNQVEARPYTTIMVAAAAGYVLGGGIPVWAGRAAVNLGSRMLVARLVSALVDDR
jgi:hypothetical protein